MDKSYIIGAVREREKSVSVEIVTPSGEVKKLRLTPAMWNEFSATTGDVVDRETYLKIKALAEKCEAVTRAIRAIADCPHSYASLSRKLSSLGFSKEAVDSAVTVIRRRRLIDEATQAEAMALRLVKTKHRGPSRVISDITAKGYPREIARQAAESVDESDYAEALRINLERKCGGEIPTEEKAREKLTLSLMRLGFSTSEIFRAMKEI